MRPLNISSRGLSINLDPQDGVKRELAAAARAANVSASDIAAAVMRSRRGEFLRIFREEAATSGAPLAGVVSPSDRLERVLDALSDPRDRARTA